MKTLNERTLKHSPAPGGQSALWSRREASVSRALYHYTRIFADRAKGAVLWDTQGKRYLDFAGGIGTLNVGHCHPRVVAAIKEQAERFLHTCFHVAPYEGYVRVCEHLTKVAPGNFPKKAVLLSTGAEAVENAVKIARRYTGREGIVAFNLSFHGRTLMALTLTGKEKPYRDGFGPYAPEVYHSPYPYPYRTPAGVSADKAGAYALERLNELFEVKVDPKRVAAMIVEPVLGEGGFVVPTPDFLPGLRKLCDRHGIVLIFDEVQTGFGRTGTMFAGEHAGVVPDLMTVAKSLGGGLPLSGVVGKAKIMDAVSPGGLGGTYGGNPLACAAALAVFEIFEEENLLKRAQAIGRLIEKRFKAWERRFDFVGEARGLGAMQALELVAEPKTKAPLPEDIMRSILDQCADRGLIILKAGLYNNVLRSLAPLVASDQEVEEGLDILESVLSGLRVKANNGHRSSSVKR
ncbi:MAG: 4-aminobutyrate--2-oxoglutarate transaminase [Elusimicrobia bacterium]|nr:4-aminobutyrate--2-oxoglutarate transaminase [Elusimicrobiota bacterium]